MKNKTPDNITCVEILKCPLTPSICLFKGKNKSMLQMSCRIKGCCWNCEKGCLGSDSSFVKFVRRSKYKELYNVQKM